MLSVKDRQIAAISGILRNPGMAYRIKKNGYEQD